MIEVVEKSNFTNFQQFGSVAFLRRLLCPFERNQQFPYFLLNNPPLVILVLRYSYFLKSFSRDEISAVLEFDLSLLIFIFDSVNFLQ